VASIEVKVGRTGRITPSVFLEPVQLAGVTISRATLHNPRFARELDVRPGDTVVIERAGDVIPKVVTVIREKRPADSRPFEMPTTCPECGTKAVEEGEYLVCPNASCPEQIRERIIHLASRQALDIDRLGEKVVDQLWTAGLLRRLEDVFRLDPRKVEELDRFGTKSADNLVAQIERAKAAPLDRFLVALGIPEVGEATAKLLARRFRSLPALRAADEATLQQVDGVGPEMARAISAFFADESNRRTVDAMLELGVKPEALSAPVEGGPLSGLSFVYTDALEGISREDAGAEVEKRGGRVVDSVSAKTSVLVAGADAGSKLAKAEKLGVRVLTPAEFRQVLDGSLTIAPPAAKSPKGGKGGKGEKSAAKKKSKSETSEKTETTDTKSDT